MNVIGAILSLICLSFIIVIFAVLIFATYLKSRMDVFDQVQGEDEAYHNAPYVDADFYAVDEEE